MERKDADDAEARWAVVVPPDGTREADTLWQEWRTNNLIALEPDDVRVETRPAEDGDRRTYWVRGVALVDREGLTSNLHSLGGAVRSVVEDHLIEYDGEVLLHLLVADLRRLAETQFDSGPGDALSQLMGVLADGLDRGDAPVQNAIAVSFVEDSCPWDPDRSAFVAAWPGSLRREARRQLDWTPHE